MGISSIARTVLSFSKNLLMSRSVTIPIGFSFDITTICFTNFVCITFNVSNIDDSGFTVITGVVNVSDTSDL